MWLVKAIMRLLSENVARKACLPSENVARKGEDAFTERNFRLEKAVTRLPSENAGRKGEKH